MQKCCNCGADLLVNSRFCGKCGSVQDIIDTDAVTARSNTPLPQSWTPVGGTLPTTWPPSSNVPVPGGEPSWSPNVQVPQTPPPPIAENEDERRSSVPWFPLYGAALGGDALLGSGQAYTPGAPMVQGVPQIGSAPSVAGSPLPYTNAPASPSMQGAGNAMPLSHPMQGAWNAAPASPSMQGAGNAAPVNPSTQGAWNVPVSRLVQGTGNVPVSHPVHWPQPKPKPPGQPGTQEHYPPHKPHRPNTHPLKHEPDQDDLHPVRHVLRRDGATKLAGGSTVKTSILVVTAVAVVAAGGIAAATHFLSHPQPFISITSNYKVGNTPAGANGRVLHISGQQFSSNSAITFLLDGHVAPGIQGTQSDSNGNFSSNVTIPNAWSAGPHTLSAKDASNDSPQNTVSVTVVQQGQANTPGPNGAPSDDASFRLKVTNANNIADLFSKNPVLIITGHPEDGTVCSPDDSGQPFTFNETSTNGMPFAKTITAACSGSYQAGQISYIETSTSIKISYRANGVNVNCVLKNPTVDLQLTGTYVGNNTFSGKINSPSFQYACEPQGFSFMHYSSQGVSWIGTVVKQ